MIIDIPFCRPSITTAELTAVKECVANGWLTMGNEVAKLEQEFAEFCEADRPGIATDSCTSALFLAMKAMNIGPDNVVAVPALTFAATANMVEALGAKVKFVDVGIDGCIDTNNSELFDVDLILAVDYAGNAVDIEGLRKFNKPIVIDSAESHGAVYNIGNKSGKTGLIHCYSFYPTKILAGAEGGMIIGATDEQAEKIKRWRLHGLSSGAENRYTDRSSSSFPVVEDIGWKHNLSDVSAAIIRQQLRRYEEIYNLRRSVWIGYYFMTVELQTLGYNVGCIREGPNSKSAPYLFVFLVEHRDNFMKYMLNNGIKCGVHFVPLHLHPYYVNKYGKLFLPLAEHIGETCVSLPLYPDLSTIQFDYIVDKIRTYFMNRSN